MKKRGRPVQLTPEQKLERQRDKWRRKKAKKRKKQRDEAWLQQTSVGYFEELEVLHYNRLIEVLVAAELLDEQDIRYRTRVDEAVDLFFDGQGDHTGWGGLGHSRRWYAGDRQSQDDP
jgi:hypothetical protein